MITGAILATGTVDVYRTGTARIDMYDIWQSGVGTCMRPTRIRLALLDRSMRLETDTRNTDEQSDEPKRRIGRFLKSIFFGRRWVIGGVRRSK